jgi:glycine hydroxymethyltransferase
MGTPAITTRGFGQSEVSQVCDWIVEILDDIDDESLIDIVRERVIGLCRQFPVYQ